MKKWIWILCLLLLCGCEREVEDVPEVEETPAAEHVVTPEEQPVELDSKRKRLYEIGAAAYEAQNWSIAKVYLSKVTDYPNVPDMLAHAEEMLLLEKNAEGERLQQSGEFRSAALTFAQTGNAEKEKEAWYHEGVLREQQGELGQAAIAFGKAGDHLDAETRSFALWDQIADRKTIGADGQKTVIITEDGPPQSTGDRPRSEYVDFQKDTIAVYGDIFLRRDGTVFCPWWSYKDLSTVTDIVAVYDNYGLRKDGVLVSFGGYRTPGGSVSDWIGTDLVDHEGTFGLRADGTVVYANDGEVRGDKPRLLEQANAGGDFVAISANGWNLAAVRRDGTVFSFPNQMPDTDGRIDENGNVIGWSDVVDVVMGDGFLIALHGDGTVSAMGRNDYGQCDVDKWTDVIAIAVGSHHTVGLQADGTVLVAGNEEIVFGEYEYDPEYGPCAANGWKASTRTQ